MKFHYGREYAIKDVIIDHVNLFRKRNADITDYQLLAKDIKHLYTVEQCIQNDYYGHATILKDYAGLDPKSVIHAAIEHGLCYGDDVWKLDYEHNFPAVLVSGHHRNEAFAKVCDKQVISIGPIIAYTKSYYSEKKIEKMKQKNGKTLVVYPSHSTHLIDNNNDMVPFIEKIKEIGKNFNKIYVCMYWKDILRGRELPFREMGWEIITAGHIYDKFFLSRAKSIFLLSDAIITNSIGDQIGQAIYFNKPVYLFNQDKEYCYNTSEIDPAKEYESGYKKMQKIFDIFSSENEEIDKKKKELCEYYFGYDSVLSVGEMRNLLQNIK